ncbi:hypothetical protein [Sphingomonas sp. PAMC 26605]|uniref:hypothetical protein n=1 Tax=Sphingomonas sp. PAMC 26605 TaxID=1112214 RepID=UPI00026CD0B7|nr:hypothetical protein [Sphingomonas sp. PAMC 26605]
MAKTPKTKPAAKRASAPTSAATAPAISRNAAWSIGAVVVAAGAGLAAFLTRGRIASALAKASGTAEGHVPTDLLDPHRNADDRAVADFRPDMDAVMTAAEREALRPPVGKPSITASNGSMNAMTAPAN